MNLSLVKTLNQLMLLKQTAYVWLTLTKILKTFTVFYWHHAGKFCV